MASKLNDQEIKRICTDLLGPFRISERFARPDAWRKHLALTHFLHDIIDNSRCEWRTRAQVRKQLYQQLRQEAIAWKKDLDREEERQRMKAAGAVYFIRADTGLVKIGRSADPRKRLQSLQTASATPLTLFHTIATDNCAALERHFHERFAERRVQGEWFALTEADLAALLTTRP